MSAVFDHSEAFEPAAEPRNPAQKITKGETPMNSITRMSQRERTRRALQMEYRVLQVLTFPVFLLIALLTFVVPKGIKASFPGLDVEGSLFARIRSIASSSIPFVFMG
jgi:hypothetical protein